MSLTKRTYVKNWPHMKPNELHQITVRKAGQKTQIKPERIAYIIEDIAYWRKANAIHKWFVDNVQNGNDDCKEYNVSRENLHELLALCTKVLEASKLVDGKINNGYRFEKGKETPIIEDGQVIEDPTVAKELLPRQRGFFFGSLEYDQYYIDDLRETKEMLTKLLAEPDEGELYYQSSW